MIISWVKKRWSNHALLWMYALGAFFFLLYGYINYYTSTLNNVPAYAFSWESKVPFIPWMIIPYMSSDIIFIIGFMIADTKSEVQTLAKRVAFVITISVICYFLFPLKFSFAKPDSSASLFNSLFVLLTADLPYNQCPSLHISQGFVFWMAFLHFFKGRFSRIFIHVWFVLIYISTLTVYQHHFIDILGGQLVGLASFFLFTNKEEVGFRNKQLAFLYYFISCAWFSASFFTPVACSILLLYFSFNYFMVGYAYYNEKHELLDKKQGKHSFWIKFAFGHFMFCNWLLWKFFSTKNKKSYAEVSTGLYFGERPRNIFYSPIKENMDWAIIDLAPEISEHEDLLKYDYYYFPLNDMSYPQKAWLHGVADKIDELLAAKKNVYVHCRLGQTRSALAICAYLIYKKKLSPEQAFTHLKELRIIKLGPDLEEIFKL